jgi:hypothetical protein
MSGDALSGINCGYRFRSLIFVHYHCRSPLLNVAIREDPPAKCPGASGLFERRQAIGILPGQGLGLSHRWGARLDYTTSDIAPQADGAVPHREFSNVPEADLSGLHAHTGFAAVVTEVDVELGARRMCQVRPTDLAVPVLWPARGVGHPV